MHANFKAKGHRKVSLSSALRFLFTVYRTRARENLKPEGQGDVSLEAAALKLIS